jgi:hypothetical protein
VELRRSDPANVGIVFQMQQAGQGFDLRKRENGKEKPGQRRRVHHRGHEGHRDSEMRNGITVDR